RERMSAVERRNAPFSVAEILDDALAERRAQLLESDMTAQRAREAFDLSSRMIDRGKQGIMACTEQVIESIDYAVEVLSRDTFGRDPASPDLAGYIACTGLATAAFIAAMTGCFWIPFCWSCAAPGIGFVYAGAIALCERIPR